MITYSYNRYNLLYTITSDRQKVEIQPLLKTLTKQYSKYYVQNIGWFERGLKT